MKKKPLMRFDELTDPQIKKLVEWSKVNPRSLCICGHSGDGGHSYHAGVLGVLGHGACTFEDCACSKFTWAGWSVSYCFFRAQLDGGR